MTSTVRLTSRNGDLTWPARIGLAGLVLGIADRIGRDPQLVYMVFGAATMGVLVAVPAEMFLGLMVLLRELSDVVADQPVAGGLNPGALLGVLAVGAGSLRLLGRRHLPALVALLPLMGLLVIWTCVGYVNYGINGSFTRELVRGTSILMIALVASASVRRMPDINRLVAIIVAATVLEAVIAIAQWVLGGDPSARERGTFAHPNTAAAAFSIALALCFWKLLDKRSKVYIAAAILLAIGLLSTRSLGGLAQMIATLMAYAVIARGAGRRLAIKALVFGVVVVGVFSLTSIGQGRVQQLQNTQSYSNTLQGADQQNSLAWRFGHWGLELKEWRVHPFFGFGAGATAKIVQPQGKIPHSDYLRYLVETGVFGTLAFGVLFVLIVAAIYRRARAPGEAAPYATALLAIIVGLVVRASEENITTQTAVMYVIAVLIGALFGLPPQAARPRARGWTA